MLTPWCRVHTEHLTGLQLVKKFPAFHGTRMFITALTSVRDDDDDDDDDNNNNNNNNSPKSVLPSHFLIKCCDVRNKDYFPAR